MIIPDWNPSELLVTELEVEIRPVCGMSLAVIVKGEDFSVGQRDPSNSLAPTVIAILVLVDIIAEMDNVIHRVFASWVSIRIEETKSCDFVSSSSPTICHGRYVRKLLHEYIASPILVTKSLAAGVVLVRPRGLVLLELQTLNWK